MRVQNSIICVDLTKKRNGKNDIIKLCQEDSYQHLLCSDIENVIWGMPNYIAANTHVTCHMPVNVYCDYQAKYDVRIADDALDIKIND